MLLTNAYRVYLQINEDEGVTKKNDGLLLHYEFCKAIALYWINNVEAMKIYRCSEASLSVSSSAQKMLFQLLASMSSMSAMDGDLTIGSSVGSGAPAKASRFSDRSIQATGALRYQLDRSLLHIPVPSTSLSVRCGLHRWLGLI